jgi:hypothetical protein
MVAPRAKVRVKFGPLDILAVVKVELALARELPDEELDEADERGAACGLGPCTVQ